MAEKTENPEVVEKQGGFKKKLIIMGGIIIFQALLSYLLIAFILKPPIAEGDTSSPNEENEEVDKLNIGEIYLLKDIIVNPAGTRGRRFISISLGIEISDGQNIEDLKIREPKIYDSVLTLLSQKLLIDYVDVSNRETIRNEILENIKEITPDDLVKQVYITKFIIQ